jgi:hypothetical protein
MPKMTKKARFKQPIGHCSLTQHPAILTRFDAMRHMAFSCRGATLAMPRWWAAPTTRAAYARVDSPRASDGLIE